MGSIQNDAKLDLSSSDLIEKLKASIKESKVLTPTSEGYTESLKRWSDSSIKPAVSLGMILPAALGSHLIYRVQWY